LQEINTGTKYENISMKLEFKIPLWLSVFGYVLFFVMIIGFTVFLPWIVPVSLIIGTVLLGFIAWGIHKRKFKWPVAAAIGIIAIIIFALALRGFFEFVQAELSGKIFIISGVAGLIIIFLSRENREIEELERFIGFEPPLKALQKNSRYLAFKIYDPRKLWSKIYNPKPKSILSSRRKR